MSFLGIFGGDEDGGDQQPSAPETVDRMVQRLQASPLPEEKRGAIFGLRAMAKTAKVDVGAKAMKPVLDALSEDHTEHDITKAGLEMLYTVMLPTKGPDGQPVPNDMGVAFTEIFVKDTSHVSLLLAILEENDHQVKYYTIKLLTLCMQNCPAQLQECFLTTPQGISRIMDHLSVNVEEVIRNEVLLLVIEMTASNVQIQKIVAFENAFEKLFEIIADEKGCEGGIIVEDCLTMAINLLQGNESNQSYFRETGCVSKLAPFLTIGTEADTIWEPQKLKNLDMMFQLLQVLVDPSNPSKVVAKCQETMQKCGVLDLLCRMCLSGKMPTAVFRPVLMTTADVVRGSSSSQAVMAELANGEALVIMLQIAYDPKRAFPDRCAALYCFQSTLYKNPDMQLRIAATFLPSPAGQTRVGPSAGQVLCQGLLAGDPLNTWFSALAFAHVLVGNRDAKEKTLRVAIQEAGASAPTSLLSVCVSNLKKLQPGPAGDERKRAALAILLITWLSDCPYAISVFLEIRDIIGHLVSQLSDSAGISQIGQGLIGVLLSACIAFNDNSNDKQSKQVILDTINKGVGQETFLKVLDKFINSDVFSISVKSPKFVDPSPEKCWFDLELAQLFRKLAVTMQTAGLSVVSGSQGPARVESGASGGTSVEHHEQTIAMYKNLIKEQDTEIASLKSQVAATTPVPAPDQSTALSAEIEQLKSQLAALQSDKQSVDNQLASTKNLLAEEAAKSKATDQRLQAALEQSKASASGNETAESEISEQLNSALADVGELHSQVASKSSEISSLQEQVSNMKKENEDLLAKLSDGQSSLKISQEDHAKALSTQQAVQGELSQLQVQHTEALQNLADAQKKSASMASELAAALEKVAAADTNLAEHEDLLICLAEQDKKISEYKERLVALGQEVSEDEEDSDEDDDEDEDEN